MRILIMNGPNLNLLGRREPDIYGRTTMEQCMDDLRARYPQAQLLYYQSNHEGDLVDKLQEAGFGQSDQTAGASTVDGVVLNAGAYTHTSVALADCIRAISVPVVEVHLSNIFAREDYRHHSLLSPVCSGMVCGFGIDVYRLAVEALLCR